MNESSDDSMDIKSIRLSDIQALRQGESKPKKKESTKIKPSISTIYAEKTSFSDDSNTPEDKRKTRSTIVQQMSSSSDRRLVKSNQSKIIHEDSSSDSLSLERSRYRATPSFHYTNRFILI